GPTSNLTAASAGGGGRAIGLAGKGQPAGKARWGRAGRFPAARTGEGRAGEDFACRQDLTGRFVPVWGLYPSAPLVPAVPAKDHAAGPARLQQCKPFAFPYFCSRGETFSGGCSLIPSSAAASARRCRVVSAGSRFFPADATPLSQQRRRRNGCGP